MRVAICTNLCNMCMYMSFVVTYLSKALHRQLKIIQRETSGHLLFGCLVVWTAVWLLCWLVVCFAMRCVLCSAMLGFTLLGFALHGFAILCYAMLVKDFEGAVAWEPRNAQKDTVSI